MAARRLEQQPACPKLWMPKGVGLAEMTSIMSAVGRAGWQVLKGRLFPGKPGPHKGWRFSLTA